MTSPRARGKGRAVANEAAGQAREYYDLLLAACRADQPGWKGAYRQMRTLLELLCRTQAGDGGLQLTDLAARVNHAAASLGLTTAELNRLHTFRLTSNDILNRRAAPERGWGTGLGGPDGKLGTGGRNNARRRFFERLFFRYVRSACDVFHRDEHSLPRHYRTDDGYARNEQTCWIF